LASLCRSGEGVSFERDGRKGKDAPEEEQEEEKLEANDPEKPARSGGRIFPHSLGDALGHLRSGSLDESVP
jgi:hypothetical protein